MNISAYPLQYRYFTKWRPHITNIDNLLTVLVGFSIFVNCNMRTPYCKIMILTWVGRDAQCTTYTYDQA